MKSAGPVGADHGAEFKAGSFNSKTYSKALNGSTPSLGKDAHNRAAKMLGYSLTLDTPDAWWSLAQVLSVRLTVKERTALALMALKSLEREDALLAAQAAFRGAGTPQPPFLGCMDQAAFWADMANTSELKAYALASYRRLSVADQAAFLGYVQGEAAA